MGSDMRELIEELRGIREHLAGIQAAAEKCLRNHTFDRLNGNRNMLEMHQIEFDKQARRWSVLQTMTEEELDERVMRRLERWAAIERSDSSGQQRPYADGQESSLEDTPTQ